MTPHELARAVRGSSVAELVWTDPDGAPDGCGVVALTWDTTPAVAFTYAVEALARSVAAAPLVVLTLTEPRSTGRTFAPVALFAHPRLVEDPEGRLFTDVLLPEELRRYPPARKFADSALLRREHWWYLPRLVVVLDVEAAHPLPARTTPHDHLLAVADGDALRVDVVRTGTPNGPGGSGRTLSPGRSVTVAAISGDDLPRGPAALVGQDATFPDLERWAHWCLRGHCDGSEVTLTRPVPAAGLPRAPSLWRRAREQWAFGRACRAGIARAERRG